VRINGLHIGSGTLVAPDGIAEGHSGIELLGPTLLRRHPNPGLHDLLNWQPTLVIIGQDPAVTTRAGRDKTGPDV
jgi:hypothetical protein